ncbi:MAG TPA: YciI family protein [Rugosimonospora sp.]|nr:YciI family protein [Rugosimonospora sp.]
MADNLPTFVVLYHYVPDMAERRTPHREAHIAWLREHAAAGRLLLAGALQEPVDTGLLVFRMPDALSLRRLLLDDPYAAADLILGVTVRPVGLVVGG